MNHRSVLHSKGKRIQRVVFFQPRTLAADNYRSYDGAEQRWAPWAALLLAPIVREAGLDVDLIDARLDPDDWVRQVVSLGPRDLFAVSVMTGHTISDAIQASEVARGRGARVLWGGPHVSLFPKETLSQAPVDAVIPGFGYNPLSHLLAILAKNEWISTNGGGVFVRSPATNQTHPAAASISLSPLPNPYLDLVMDWEQYLNQDVAIASRTVNFITSEGCPHRCTFCSEPRTSKRTWLAREPSQVVSVAKDLCNRTGANGLKLHDPNFFHDMPRAMRFAHQFFDEVGVPWAASMHPGDLVPLSEECLHDLSRLGLVRLLIGLESPDARIVRLAGKQYDPSRIMELASKLARARIRGMFTFMVGWPDADPDHYGRTVDCAVKIRDIWEEHQAKIHFLEPWPGTPIFEILARRGFQFPQTIREWANIDYYQAEYAMIHDPKRLDEIRDANRRLSPYVNA